VRASISSSEVLHLIQVERKKDNKDVEGTKGSTSFDPGGEKERQQGCGRYKRRTQLSN
jgi:hypothetical protein